MTTGRRASYLPEDRPWPFPGGESGNVRSPERALSAGATVSPQRGEGWHVQSAVAEAPRLLSSGSGFFPVPFSSLYVLSECTSERETGTKAINPDRRALRQEGEEGPAPAPSGVILVYTNN